MKKFILLICITMLVLPVNAGCFSGFIRPKESYQVKRAISNQVKYANKCNFNKFISTYDKDYKNCDGFDLKIYSQLVKEIWDTYDNIRYNVKVKDVKIEDNSAIVEVTEYTNADLKITKNYNGELKSKADSIYYMKKTDGKWKVLSDLVLDERTSMLYGEAKDLNIMLTVPEQIQEDTEYTATLEFVPPKDTLAIASISSDKVEYPQKTSKEVYRAMPEDNILERLFTSNKDKVNEYVIASIGLTKTDVCDLSIKLSLTGFGYVIRRVNVLPAKIEESADEQTK